MILKRKGSQLLISAWIVLAIAGGFLFGTGYGSEDEEAISFEERPDVEMSAEEKAVNERHYLRSLEASAKKGVEAGSAYANGKLTGTWRQKEFLSSGNHGYGFRVDGSVYDRGNDVLYAISYAGHIWKINRSGNEVSDTKWELMNHTYNFLGSYMEGLNKSDGSFRMVRSYSGGMQYSDDEGRNWVNVSGLSFVSLSTEGAVSRNSSGNKVIVVGEVQSKTLKALMSTDEGTTYEEMGLSFNPDEYEVKLLKVSNSESTFLLARNKGTSKLLVYECGENESSFSLVHSPELSFNGLNRVFGTYYNDAFHFYVTGLQTHIYYSSDKGATWEVKSSSNDGDGDIRPRTVHPTKPNVIFRGYLDVYMSSNYGGSFTNFSHSLGWDVHHMRMYEKADGSYFHFVGKDFGCYISDEPDVKSAYTQLNYTSPIQMIYDADHSEQYNSSFSATQDRGTMGYLSTPLQSYTKDVKTTDGLRVRVANDGESVWTWMYYGSIFHQSNFAARSSALAGVNWTSNWWSAPMISSPVPGEDAIYVAAGEKLTKFSYNETSNEIIETSHYVNFLSEFGDKIGGFGYSEINKDRWYVSLNNGVFCYSEDGGQTFSKGTTSGIPPKANDQSYNYRRNQQVIKASRLEEKKVYFAGVGNTFQISDDGGKTFSNHMTGLDVYRIRDFDLSADEQFVFAACASAGVWVYSAVDDRWYAMNDAAIPNVDFSGVEYIEKDNVVRFATYGCGILELELEGIEVALAYPDSLAIDFMSRDSVVLSWKDKSDNEEGFYIERGEQGVFSVVDSVDADVTSYCDKDVEALLYTYRVRAFNASAKSYPSNYRLADLESAGAVPKAGWILVSVDSEEAEAGYPAIYAFDEDESTMWHTQWTVDPKPGYPHELVIDMHDTLTLYGFSYLTRQDNQWNGTIKDYEFYVSMDNSNWQKAVSGSWPKNRSLKEVYFNSTMQARYLKLRALSEVNGAVYAACAELSVMINPATEKMPKTPQFIQAGRVSDTEIELLWLDLSDDEQGFILEQELDGAFIEIQRLSAGATSASIMNTKLNKSYTFRIAAYNSLGNSDYSREVSLYGIGDDTGVGELERENLELLLYPNPVEDILYVESTEVDSQVQWRIIAMNGSVVRMSEENAGDPCQGIYVSDLEAGVYLFEMNSGLAFGVKTFIKK